MADRDREPQASECARVFRDPKGRVVLAGGSALPAFCVRCGGPGDVIVKRALSSYWVDDPATFREGSRFHVPGAPPPRPTRYASIEYRMCERHHLWRGWGPRVAIVVGIGAAGAILHGLLGRAGLPLLLGIVLLLACGLLFVRAGVDPVIERIEGGFACIRGIHPSVVSRLPPVPEKLEDEGPPAEQPAPESVATERIPCPDDCCTGILSAEGRCGTCGRLA